MSRETQVDPPVSQPLRSKHTPSFPTVLKQLGISVLVTTYQAGKLVLLRADGDKVNTHFRDLARPMGLAADSTRLAVGAAQEIRQYRNMAPVSRRLEPTGRHDACYLPRSVHVTGDIDIHEMAWTSPKPSVPGGGWQGDGELWFVNTRFSCLCTLNGVHSFVPRCARRSSRPWLPKTAAISTAWDWPPTTTVNSPFATSRLWPPPTRRKAGERIRRTAAL